MMRTYQSFIFTAAALALTTGCGESVEPLGPGTLQLGWSVEPRGCEASGVEEVEIELEAATYYTTERFDCDRGQAQLTGLPSGNYRVRAEGLTSSGRAIYAAELERVTVRAERAEQAPPLVMSAVPARLEVSWRIADGQVCGAAGVEEIDVLLFDDADYVAAAGLFDCNEGRGQVGDVPAGTYQIVAWGVGTDGAPTGHSGRAETTVKRGDRGQVTVVLEP